MGGARAEFWKPREKARARAEPESIRKRFCPRVVGESKLRKLPEERSLSSAAQRRRWWWWRRRAQSSIIFLILGDNITRKFLIYIYPPHYLAPI